MGVVVRFSGRLSGLRYSSNASRLGVSSRRSSSSKNSSKLSSLDQLKSLYQKSQKNVSDKKSVSNPLANVSINVYNKIEAEAKNASAHTNKLLNTEKGNLFDGKINPDKAVISEVTAFVADYNSLMTTMQNSGSKTYKEYAGEIKNQMMMTKDSLSEVGITYRSDGSLAIDSKKLETADIDKLKSLFNNKDSLVAKIAGKISDVGKRAALDKIISSYDSGQSVGLNSKA